MFELLLILIFAVALLPVVIGGYSTFIQSVWPKWVAGHKTDNKDDNLKDPQQEKEEAINNRIKSLEQQLQTVTDDISRLKCELVKISNQSLQSQKKTVDKPKDDKIIVNTHDDKFSPQVKYAEQINSNGVENRDLKDTNSEYAYLKVTITSPNEAQFVINDLEAAQSKLIANIMMLDYYATIGQAPSKPRKIVTKKPGKLKFNGQRWTPDVKAAIELQ